MSQPDSVEADFDFAVEVMVGFFAQSHIRRGLAIIDDIDVTGWEKWWQVELAIFLADHEDIGDWDIEEEFLTDLRRGGTKDFVAADIAFRRKRHAANRLIILELKQNDDWRRCVGNMLSDVAKIQGAHSRSLSGAQVRSFFAVGVYPYTGAGTKEVHDYVEDLAEKRGVPWDLMETRRIKDTRFSFTVL